MGRYPCIWIVRFGSLQVWNVARILSVGGIGTRFWHCSFRMVSHFWSCLFYGPFWIPFLGNSPKLAFVLDRMTFLAFFCAQLSSRFLHSGLALKPYICGVPDSLCPRWANFCRRRDPPGGPTWLMRVSSVNVGTDWSLVVTRPTDHGWPLIHRSRMIA
jgi:hypothetical protein